MQFQVDVSSATPPIPTSDDPLTPPQNEVAELLKQLLEVQREQLAYQQAVIEAQNHTSRWRAYMDRWRDQFPHLGVDCRRILPILEQSFGQLVTDLSDHLRDQDDELSNEFTLREMLDRFGPSMAHLGAMLNLVAPLAEAGSLGDS